ncbi:hypothetical protein BC938DRAFT_473866, partial [Jimgerdemannia flammicorona]
TDARPDNWDSYWKDAKQDLKDLPGYLGNRIIASRAILNDSQKVDLILYERRLLLVEEKKRLFSRDLPRRNIYRDVDTNDIEVVEDKRDPRKLRLCFCKMMRTEAQFENSDKKAEWLIMLRHHNNNIVSPRSTTSTTSSNPPFFHVSGPRQSLPPESPVITFNEIDSGILVESPTSESPRRGSLGSMGSTRSGASGHSYFLRALPGTQTPNYREDDASSIANPQRGTDAPDASASLASPVDCCHHADPTPPSSPTYLYGSSRYSDHRAENLRINTNVSTRNTPQVDENHQPTSSDPYDVIRQDVLAKARAQSACFSFESPTSVHH